MSDPFIGEIKMFAGNFAPRSWALCDGQLVAVTQNEALFSLLGTIYGGDGRTTFGLPDMRGRIPLHQGQGPGLSNRRIGEKFGTENETLTTQQLPAHNHQFQASTNPADSGYPAANVVADTDTTLTYRKSIFDPDTPFPANTISNSGSSQPHSNIMPFQCINFIIALFGVYPSRS